MVNKGLTVEQEARFEILEVNEISCLAQNGVEQSARIPERGFDSSAFSNLCISHRDERG